MDTAFCNAEVWPVVCALCNSDRNHSRYSLERGAIVRCENCGFHYVSPRLNSSALQRKLQQWSRQDVVDAERLRIAFDTQTLSLYQSHLARLAADDKPGRLLDIGCATGALLSVAEQLGWQASGLEIGAASAHYATTTLGLCVTAGSLYSYDAPPESFDAIVFLEVIEHLEDPAGALKRIATWLKPGGYLLISTPNFDSLFRRRFGTRWWVINCEDEHIQFFTAESLKRALATQGLHVTWSRIRGIDWSGLWRAYREGRGVTTPGQMSDGTGYHGARRSKEAVKSALARLGLLRCTRALLAGFDALCSIPHSPTYAWGEQLIMIAVKK